MVEVVHHNAVKSSIVLATSRIRFTFSSLICLSLEGIVAEDCDIDLERKAGDIKGLQRMCSWVSILGILSFIFFNHLLYVLILL
ncbi:hypothetical protein Syun_025607 [Stephania yunnanensis]|uniref:Uncharacterized protein n=1 Tax=Stephania yunnanensis TaxID=152371 RepID=A0AAP0HV06_9MAGN